MLGRFEKKDIKIVVVAPSATFRGLLTSLLKELGFHNLTTVADIRSSIEIMETEPVQWILCPNKDSIGGHALHLLSILEQQPALRAMKISILRDEDDSTLAHAFELGAFSAHRLETSRDSVLAELQKLLQRLERYDGDAARVSAEYLIDFLREKEEYQEIKRFLKSMLQIYPGRTDLIFELARNHLDAGEFREGKLLLQQLLLVAPERRPQIDALVRNALSGETLEAKPETALAEHFGFQTCLLLDSDERYRLRIEAQLREIGFSQIGSFSEPFSAMNWLRKNPEPDLVISEWSLPQIPGPLALYKIRNRIEAEVPIIVMNSEITQRDEIWLRELGVNSQLRKPIEAHELFRAIIWTMQQRKGPTDIQSLKLKLKVLSRRQDRELPRYRQLFVQHPLLIESERLLMEAVLSYDAACYLHAKKFAMDAMKEGSELRETLEVLSKSLMKLREFDAAIRCLENVTFLSPYNVTHLCEIAECHLEKGDEKTFESYLDKARDLDPDAQIVLETEAKAALKRGQTEKARKLLQSLKSFKEVLAFMNNRAVSLIQVGQHTEGLQLYRQAIDSLPEGQAEVRFLLHYNYGLGLARVQRLSDAENALMEACRSRSPARLKKARSLLLKVQQARHEGRPVDFPQDRPSTLMDEEAKLEMLREVQRSLTDDLRVRRDDYCVNKIFRSLIDDTRAREIVHAAPIFVPRGKLVKDFLHGISVKKGAR